ncbi:MAG: hypothetical protein ACJ8CR_04525 [Roseiflexaceae bacterium]
MPEPKIAVARPALDVQHLKNCYTFREDPQIAAFLNENMFLIPLLHEAYLYISKYFPDSPLALEVVRDPEGNTCALLVVAIATSLEPDEAIMRLDRFDKSWWFGAVDRAQGKLTISLEYL